MSPPEISSNTEQSASIPFHHYPLRKVDRHDIQPLNHLLSHAKPE